MCTCVLIDWPSWLASGVVWCIVFGMRVEFKDDGREERRKDACDANLGSALQEIAVKGKYTAIVIVQYRSLIISRI